MINSLIYNSELINRNIDKYLVEIRFSKTLAQLRRNSVRKFFRFLKLQRDLKKSIRTYRPDFIYFSFMPVGKGFWRDLLLARTIKKSGVVPIYHLHNRGIADNSGKGFFRMIYRYVFDHSVIIHLSEKLMEREILALALKNAKTFVLENGFPVNRFRRPATTNPVPCLLFVSNLFPAKGIYLLVRIMSELRERGLIVQLRIVGEALRKSYKRKLQRMIDLNELGDRMVLTGSKFGDDLIEEYARADIFLFPSIFIQECAPLVILEAMQTGLPVIASKIGAIPEIIEDGVEGLLAEPGNIKMFTDNIAGLIQDVPGRMQLGMAAKKKFESRFTYNRFEESFRKILNELSVD